MYDHSTPQSLGVFCFPFQYHNLCESPISTMKIVTVKKRNIMLHLEGDLCSELSTIRPDTDKLHRTHQAEVSH